MNYGSTIYNGCKLNFSSLLFLFFCLMSPFGFPDQLVDVLMLSSYSVLYINKVYAHFASLLQSN